MKEIHLICNPTSGKGKTLEILNKIKEWASAQNELKLIVHNTENVGHATSITRDLTINSNPVTIFVLGGDGSVNEVLNGVQNFDTTTIGILPYGSGNDFARTLGITDADPIELINAYVNKTTERKVDYLLINDKYRAINEIGLGMPAEVIAYRDKMKHFSPKTQYKIATAIRSLFWKAFDYELSIDKQPANLIKTMWFSINNGNTIGGGVVTTPDAKIDDGLITIMYLRKFNRIKTLGMLLKAKKGKASKLKIAQSLTCKELDLRGKDMTAEYDGILLEHVDHFNVKIVPNKVRLLVK